ncbi:hypothetical protein CBS101457_006401 [Exobasidium rhododendri]|nr:hypothetical protein CBS101457_006401 [Exobasidium rhododendri]
MSSPEDAAKAYDLAMKHSESGNLPGALKWAKKALAIDPSLSKAKVLLTSLEKGHMPGRAQGSSSAGTSNTNGKVNGTAAEGTRKRTSEKTEPAAPKREYTREQSRVVAQVHKAGREHDYYAVLLLVKEDNPDENAIKKGYRKLALQLHPDKNGAPGADEAFKIVSKAFTILSDGDKRAVYDRYGGDPDARGGGGGGGGGSNRAGAPAFRTYGSGMGGGGMNGEIDPQDLFNMFFGGGMGNGFGGGGTTFSFGGPGGGMRTAQFGGQQRRARAAEGGAGNRNEQESTPVLLQLLPIIILGLFSLLSYAPTLFSTPDPGFTWKPQGLYRQPRMTPAHNVQYHVDPNAWNAHPFIIEANSAPNDPKVTSKLRDFERRVEKSYKTLLYSDCERHRQYQERRIQATWGTLGWGAKPDLERKIRSEKFDSCERLRDFGVEFGPLI